MHLGKSSHLCTLIFLDQSMGLNIQEIRSLSQLLSKNQRIVITTHQKPDADALGSSLALGLYLKKKGNEVNVISPTDYPDFLNWMAGNEEVIVFDNSNKEKIFKLIEQADIIFCLDFNSLDRINQLGKNVGSSPAVKVLMDHHLEPQNFADHEFWDIEAAATAEIVYEFIIGSDERNLIDSEIAENLYAGLMTDTGGFRHSNTTKKTHSIAADLMELGADVTRVSKLVYDNNTVDRIKFLGFALSEKLKVLTEDKVAYFAISAKDLSKFNSKTGDTEGLVNYALSIEGIVVAALIIEKNDFIKISFRSVGNFSVNDFARAHFEGGGHRNAAGGISKLSLEETVAKFEGLVKEYKDQIDNCVSSTLKQKSYN